jgi:hypothetical protein
MSLCLSIAITLDDSARFLVRRSSDKHADDDNRVNEMRINRQGRNRGKADLVRHLNLAEVAIVDHAHQRKDIPTSHCLAWCQ